MIAVIINNNNKDSKQHSKEDEAEVSNLHIDCSPACIPKGTYTVTRSWPQRVKSNLGGKTCTEPGPRGSGTSLGDSLSRTQKRYPNTPGFRFEDRGRSLGQQFRDCRFQSLWFRPGHYLPATGRCPWLRPGRRLPRRQWRSCSTLQPFQLGCISLVQSLNSQARTGFARQVQAGTAGIGHSPLRWQGT